MATAATAASLPPPDGGPVGRPSRSDVRFPESVTKRKTKQKERKVREMSLEGKQSVEGDTFSWAEIDFFLLFICGLEHGFFFVKISL